LVAVVCDGAGSATRAEQGAAMFSSSFGSLAKTWIEKQDGLSGLDQSTILEWVQQCLHLIETDAQEAGMQKRDYACTFLAALVGAEDAYFLQIGDGGIVIADAQNIAEYFWIFWPQKGQYHNTTNFITDDDCMDNLQFEYCPIALKDIALFSDGIENIALKFDTSEAYQPFFKNLFGTLRHDNASDLFSDAITVFLNSDKVNERTDDDKTLIIASRMEED